MFKSKLHDREIALAEAGADDNFKSSKASWVLRICSAAVVVMMVWAYFAQLDEVATGTGKVVPSSKAKVIQSLEGGILAQLNVDEGDVVEAGQVLAELDPTRLSSSYEETAARVRSLQARSTRLYAEIDDKPLRFSDEIKADAALVQRQTSLYMQRRENLSSATGNLRRSQGLLQQELTMTQPLVARGAASNVEVLRLRRQINELQTKIDEVRHSYAVGAREELAKVNSELESLLQVAEGRADQLKRATVVSPVRGIVKDIQATTLGGVVAPGGKLMDIVPLEDQLLIEARINPRDIAFIRPGLDGNIKISAYESSIYGTIKGKVDRVSPDSIQDEVRRDQFYYRVYIRTDGGKLTNQAGKTFSIVPGMMATVDIQTGGRTVWQYLVKPLNKMGEALRER
jgi:adhesin transport system membrane fusion protein